MEQDCDTVACTASTLACEVGTAYPISLYKRVCLFIGQVVNVITWRFLDAFLMNFFNDCITSKSQQMKNGHAFAV